MFAKLTERLGKAVDALRGRGRLTEDNIAESLREVRMALLEADVALPVVKRFIDAVKAKAVGAEVVGSLTPGQALIGVIHDELVAIMGGAARSPSTCAMQPPAVILLAGLQGAGKTTTAGKLARHLIGQKKRVLLVEHRHPAAGGRAAAAAPGRAGGRGFPSRGARRGAAEDRNRRAAMPRAVACSTC